MSCQNRSPALAGQVEAFLVPNSRFRSKSLDLANEIEPCHRFWPRVSFFQSNMRQEQPLEEALS